MRIINGSNSKLNRNYLLEKEPTGFIAGTTITITYNDVARTITLTGDIRALFKGDFVPGLDVSSGSWTSQPHPENITQTYYLKYSALGFTWDTSQWEFTELQIAYLDVDPITGVRFAQREVHGLMNGATHNHLHKSIGTFRVSGGDLLNYTIGSTVATNRRPNVSQCVVVDEDCQSTILAFDKTVETYAHLYLSGANTAKLEPTKTDIVNIVSTWPQYNLFTGGVWTQAELPNNRFMSVWCIAIPTSADAFSNRFRFVYLQGQSISLSLATEQALSPLNLSLGTLVNNIPEFTYINQVILQRAGGGWSIAAVTSLRGSRAMFIGQAAIPLASLPASQIVYDNTTSLLVAINAQAAIDEINSQLATKSSASSATPTLVAVSWAANSITVTVTGVTASNIIIVSPVEASYAAYTAAKVRATAQGVNTITFSCDSTPAVDLSVNVVIIN